MGVVPNDYHNGGLPGRPAGPAATRPNRADRCEYEDYVKHYLSLWAWRNISSNTVLGT